MSPSARYIKIVEWSDEDGAFVGQCPGVIGPCCHGPDEVEVYRQLCEIVSEWLELAAQLRSAPPQGSRAACSRCRRGPRIESLTFGRGGAGGGR